MDLHTQSPQQDRTGHHHLGEAVLLHARREPHVPAQGSRGRRPDSGPGQLLCDGRGLRGPAILLPDLHAQRQTVRSVSHLGEQCRNYPDRKKAASTGCHAPVLHGRGHAAGPPKDGFQFSVNSDSDHLGSAHLVQDPVRIQLCLGSGGDMDRTNVAGGACQINLKKLGLPVSEQGSEAQAGNCPRSPFYIWNILYRSVI